MIITRQAIGCVFESLSQQKTLKQKSDSSLPRCPTFCSFLEHSSFPINRFFVTNHVQLAQFIFFYTCPSLVTAQSTVAVGAKVADKKFPLRPLVFKTQLYYFANTSLFITPPFERVHKHKCCIIYPIIRPMSILW